MVMSGEKSAFRQNPTVKICEVWCGNRGVSRLNPTKKGVLKDSSKKIKKVLARILNQAILSILLGSTKNAGNQNKKLTARVVEIE
jgi:hypothetical protein